MTGNAANEEKRLIKLFENKGIDPDKLAIAADLIKDIAFMTVKTIDLKAEIDENGIIERYQNGNNQFGLKKSPAVDVYLNMTKQKSALIKQLIDLLPDDIPIEEDDGFEAATKARKNKNELYHSILQSN